MVTGFGATETRRTGFDVVAVVRQVTELLAPIAPESLAIGIIGDRLNDALGNAQERFASSTISLTMR